ncbi:hypothetical protein TcG_10894 [Trypanosoma cruzi]|nr:hypothetical protein TcG_10894 [Trypanosoma cruzi]
MTLCTKGMGRSSDPHRRRMPWMAEKECVPGVVHSSKEKMVLDGARRVDVDCVDRASQVYPLEALRATVAACEYNTFRGKNIFKAVSQAESNVLGQWVYCKEWQEGTHDEDATSTAIHFLCHGSSAARANTPCGFSGVTCGVPFAAIVPPIPERRCRLPRRCMFLSISNTHPLIDAADTAAHCWCFWDDRCTAPAAGAVGLGTRTQQNKFSQLVLAALSASRLPQLPTHTTGEHRNRRDREGINGVSGHQFSFNITPGQVTVGISNNTIHQQWQMKSDHRRQRQHHCGLPHHLPFFASYCHVCVLWLRLRWLRLHEVVCAEYERRPMATELFF